MIKIAFCDDEHAVVHDLCVLLDRYRTERDQSIEHTAFQSPIDLLAEIERGARFDIIFLDILMPGETGINAAAEIRNYDTNVKIIFLTSSSEFAVQSYTVEAYYYYLKPICPESLFQLLDRAISACEKEQTESLILRCKSGITRIELRNLEYCEVIHRTLFIHLSNGTVLESIGCLNTLSKQLQRCECFIRPHRSYLVNLGYIQSISYQEITTSSLATIPIPRGKYHQVKDAYLEYAFQTRQVMV